MSRSDCYLDYHTPAVALACPGVDYIRLWPLPVKQPWQETPDPLPEDMRGDKTPLTAGSFVRPKGSLLKPVRM